MKRYITYEIRNNLGNFMSMIFGFLMPLFMTILIFHAYKGQMPKDSVGDFATQIYLTNIIMIPMAMILIGFAATYSQEIEQGVTRRLELFGYVHKKQMIAKFGGQLIVVVSAILLYTIIICIALPLHAPKFGSLFAYLLCVFALILMIFLIAYAIAMLTQKFSVAFGITMSVYFGVMICSGMMGVTAEQFPKPVRFVAELLPTTRMVEIFPDAWNGKLSNVAPLIQAFLLCYGVTGILLFLVVRKNKRKKY